MSIFSTMSRSRAIAAFVVVVIVLCLPTELLASRILSCSFDHCPSGVKPVLCYSPTSHGVVRSSHSSLSTISGESGMAIESSPTHGVPEVTLDGFDCDSDIMLPLTLVTRYAVSNDAVDEETFSLLHMFASPQDSAATFPASNGYPGISVYFHFGQLVVAYRTEPKSGLSSRYASASSVLNSTSPQLEWQLLQVEISEGGVSVNVNGESVPMEMQYSMLGSNSSQAFLAACDTESRVARMNLHFGDPFASCHNVTSAFDYIGLFTAEASEVDTEALPGDTIVCRPTPSAPAVLPQTRYYSTPNLDIHRGLVSYWHFDDDSYIDEMDSSRFGFVELANVEGNYTRSAQGVLAGHGFRLDPGLDSGWLNLSSPIPLDGATAYSFSLWVQARDASISGRDFFPGNLLYATSSAVGVYSLESTNAALTPSAISDLFHIVYTCSGGRRALYVNGALERKQVGVSTVEFPALELIGRGDSASGLNVDIDDLRFYNYSLSGREVTQLNQFCSSTDAVERVLKRIGNVYHCFQMFSDRITYSEAAARCNRLPNGHLATVTSYEENEMLQSLTESSGTINNGAYIGLRWTSRNGVNVHLWDNQEVGSYSNFASGFPRADGNEYCAIHSRYNFGWTEVSCAQDLPYICEQTSPILELCDRGSDHLMAYSGDSSEATCIEFVDDQHEGNWSEAREMCHGIGGDLISLSDSNLVEAMGYFGGDGELAVFVGGSDFGNESVAITEWLNGEFIDESLLSEGLTNLTGCFVYVRDSEGNSSIEGRSCSDVLPFVCLRRIDLGKSEGMDPLVYDATVRNTSHLGHFESSGCGYADEECVVHDGFLPVGSVIEVSSVFNYSEIEPRRLVLSSVVLDAGKEELSVWLEDGGEGGTFLRVFGGDVNVAFEDLTSDQTLPVYVYGEYTIRIAVQISGYVVSLEYDSDLYEAYVQRLPTFSNTFRVEAFGFEKGYEASVYVDECGPVMEECVGIGNTCEVSGLRRGSVVRAVGPFDPSETFSIDFGTENGDRPFHLHYDPISFLGLRMYSVLNGAQLPAENTGIDLGSGMRDLEFHIVVGARGYDLYILEGGNATSRVSTGLLHYFFEFRSDAPITWLIFDGFGDEDSLVRYDVYDAPESDCYPAYDPAACEGVECSEVLQEGLVFHMDPGNAALRDVSGNLVNRIYSAAPHLLSGVANGDVGMGSVYPSFVFGGTHGFAIERPWEFNFAGSNALTFSIWMRIPNPSSDFNLNGYVDGAAVRLGERDGMVYLDAGDHVDVGGNETVFYANEWSQLTMVVDSFGGRSFKLYANGELIQTGTDGVPGSLVNPTKFGIGASIEWVSGAYRVLHGVNGEVGEVHVYNRGLSAEEVNVNYERSRERLSYGEDICPSVTCGTNEECVSLPFGFECECASYALQDGNTCVMNGVEACKVIGGDCDDGLASSSDGGWELMYDLSIPTHNGYSWNMLNLVPYDYSCAKHGACPDTVGRVAYFLELDDEWVWVSMDPFTFDSHKLGVPAEIILQQPVTSVNAISSGPVPNAFNTSGSIEFWPTTYQPGPDNKYNDVDTRTDNGYYGSMQVFADGSTVFAFNGWGREGNREMDVGIGMGPLPHTDWTDTSTSGPSALDYATRRMRIYGRLGASQSLLYPSPSPIAADSTPCSYIGSECDGNAWTLAYDLQIPLLGNWDTISQVPYSFKCTDDGSCPTSIRRVAYLLELDSEWVWVSFAAFSTSVYNTGIPVDYVYDNYLYDGAILSNTDKVTPVVNATFIAEFFSHTYATVDGIYDHRSVPGSTVDGHGSFQIFDGNNQTVFGYNGFSQGSSPSIGIGVNPGEHPDWTFARNVGSYTTRRFRVYVSSSTRRMTHLPASPSPSSSSTVSATTSVTGTVTASISPSHSPSAAPTLPCGIPPGCPDGPLWELMYDLDIPLVPYWRKPVDFDYSFNCNNCPDYVEVAYWLELDSDFVWVSMQRFSGNYDHIYFPTIGTPAMQQPVEILEIVSSVIPSVSTPFTGKMEFMIENYSPGGDGFYDSNDLISTGRHGSVQLFDAAGNTIFGISGYAVAGGTVSLGIGNSNSPTGTDWTREANAGNFSTRRIRCYIRPAPAPR